MTTTHVHRTSVAWLPAITAFFLTFSAIGLLAEDAILTGHVTSQHLLAPVLVGATVASAVLCHRYLVTWNMFGALAMLIVALGGSALQVWGTVGRTAAQRDGQVAVARAGNEAQHRKADELKTARTDMARECRLIGPRCQLWQGQVAKLSGELSDMAVISLDPRMDAAVNLVNLVSGADKDRVRATLSAIDPVSFPMWLELAAVIFGVAAFPCRKVSTLAKPEAPASEETVQLSRFTREKALADLKKLKAIGSQQFLAEKWGVSEGQVSKWMAGWERDGQIERAREGKCKATLALPPPHQGRRHLGHMARV